MSSTGRMTGTLGWWRRRRVGYPPVGTPSYLAARSFFTVGRRAVFGSYYVFVGLLRFDTSALPDGATVTSAELRLHVKGKADGDNRGLVGEWYGASNWPIDGGDWSLNSSGTALPAVDLTGISGRVGELRSIWLGWARSRGPGRPGCGCTSVGGSRRLTTMCRRRRSRTACPSRNWS